MSIRLHQEYWRTLPRSFDPWHMAVVSPGLFDIAGNVTGISYGRIGSRRPKELNLRVCTIRNSPDSAPAGIGLWNGGFEAAR